jgi:hypothetical protein
MLGIVLPFPLQTDLGEPLCELGRSGSDQMCEYVELSQALLVIVLFNKVVLFGHLTDN